MSASDARSDSGAPKKPFNVAIVFAICGALFSLLIFLFMLKQEREAVIQQFQIDMNYKVAAFEQQLTLNLQSLESLQAYYLMSDQIKADSFKEVASRIAARSPELQALLWVPEADTEKLWVAVNGNDSLIDEEAVQQLLQKSPQVSELTLSRASLSEGNSIVAVTPAHSGGKLIALISAVGLVESTGLSELGSGIVFKFINTETSSELISQGEYADSAKLAPDTSFQNHLLRDDSNWLTSYAATDEYVTQRMSYLPALFLLTGLLISFLFAAYLKRIMKYLNNLRDEQEVLCQQLMDVTWSDPLTGIANRGYFDETLDIECRRAVRDFSPLTLVLIELDKFDEYEAHYGAAGAEVTLQRVASALRESVGRPGDMVARIDDNQFAYLLPSTNELVVQLADRCCKEVFSLGIAHEASQVSSVVTVSIGVSTLQPSRFMTPERMLASSKEQLVKAQTNGGNQYQAYAEQGLEPSLTYSV